MNHTELTTKAIKWLLSQGHAIVLSEIKCFNTSGEIVDALGFKSQISTLVECKASRADFLADKNKHFRKESHKGVGQHRYYLCEPDIIKPEDLPAKWGLLYATKRGIKKVVYPAGLNSEQEMMQDYNHHSERTMLISTIRRLGVFQDGIEGKVFFKEKLDEIAAMQKAEPNGDGE